MTPPYKLVDMETGKDVPNFVGMDTDPGRFIEVYSGDAAGNPTARISGGALKRPDGVVVDPPPVDPPVDPPPIDPPPVDTGDDMLKPKNAAEFKSMVQSALNVGSFAIFAPGIALDVTTPMVFDLKNVGAPHGIIGNGIKLNWKGAGGPDMLTFKGNKVNGVCTGLMLSSMYMFGNGYAGDPAGDCLKLYAPEGDPGAIYKFVLRDIYTNYATRGIVLEGAVFEGYCENIHAENMRSHGMETLHTHTAGEHQGIISNISIVHPNLSRNTGAGLKCTYSTNVTMGSFVLNALGGILAPEGLRYAVGNNGENTGESLFVVPSHGWGSFIQGNEVSSDGSTHHRRFENGTWVSYGKPCLYLLDRGSDTATVERDNHCSYYGSSPTSPMRVVK